MPYISRLERDIMISPKSAGELNYRLTMTLLQYIKNQGESYKNYNDIIGALECCKMEFYRRMIAKYEDFKMLENGDVFPEDK